jgi:hypothetical protein
MHLLTSGIARTTGGSAASNDELSGFNRQGGFEPGADPQRRDYASFAGFADPDGNTWVLPEIGHRQEKTGGSSLSAPPF